MTTLENLYLGNISPHERPKTIKYIYNHAALRPENLDAVFILLF